MKILFITQLCPYPPTNGSAIKTYNTLKHLGSNHDIHLLAFIRQESEVKMLAHLKPYCREIDHCIIKRSKVLNAQQAVGSLVAGKSFIIARDHNPEMQARVLAGLSQSPDLIYADHLQMFQYVPDAPPCPVILDDHNVEWRIIERFASTGTHAVKGLGRLFAAVEWRRLRDFELRACRKADLVITVTDEDRRVLSSNGIPSDRIVPLPVGVDTDYFRPVSSDPEDRKMLNFGTMSWPPNADAAAYFAADIYPLIKNRVPDARFSIVGANPPPEIRALAEHDPMVEVTGFVDDIRESAQGTAAFVVPLRVGSGMRVKILDAMAMGLPIVTTSVGCEGISLNPGEHALVADTPEDFAEAAVRLLTDPGERERLGLAGRRLVEELYAWPPILGRLDSALHSLVGPHI